VNKTIILTLIPKFWCHFYILVQGFKEHTQGSNVFCNTFYHIVYPLLYAKPLEAHSPNDGFSEWELLW